MRSGYEWLRPFAGAEAASPQEPFRIIVGGPDCSKPVFGFGLQYFGDELWRAQRQRDPLAQHGRQKAATSPTTPARAAISPYHRENGGDIIWEIGSGYFSCRNGDGTFCAGEVRARRPQCDQVKMIEIKLQPGREARPWRRAARRQGHGRNRRDPRRAGRRRLHLAVTPFSVLDADRDDAVYRHAAALIGRQAGGFKLCIGHPWEFLAICKAMLETEIYPDFIVVDGKEGGTGAAPLEFLDHLGMPMREGLISCTTR